MNAKEVKDFIAPHCDNTDREVVSRFVDFFSGPFTVDTVIAKKAMYKITDGSRIHFTVAEIKF